MTDEHLFKSEEYPFGDLEHAVVSLALDKPEMFSSISKHLKPEHFRQIESRFIVQEILEAEKKWGYIPNRETMKGLVKNVLTTKNQDYKAILNLLDRKLDPREKPVVTDFVISWARDQQYGMLYQEQGIDFFQKKQYDKIDKIIEDAQSITVKQFNGSWLSESVSKVFQKDAVKKLTLGFPSIDNRINNGGPAKKQVVTWLAGTNVGKTIVGCNCGVALVRAGFNVLHITLESTEIDVLQRYVGSITKVNTFDMDVVSTNPDNDNSKQLISNVINQVKSSLTREGDAYIHEFGADELSVNDIRKLLEHLRNCYGWIPDAIIVDYLELMVPKKITRSDQDNKEHLRQKKISTELLSLAKSEDVLIITMTQGNRPQSNTVMNDKGKPKDGQSEGREMMGLNRMADSYGKASPLSVVISINVLPGHYEIPHDQIEEAKLQKIGAKPCSKIGKYTFKIVKNRHGPKGAEIEALVNYSNMHVTEYVVSPANI